MNSRKKLVIISIISIIGIFILALATSYALFTINVTKNRNFKVVVGNLELSLNDTNQGNTFDNGKIVVSNMVPMRDSTGMEQAGYSFTLTNTGTIDASYSIFIDDVVLAELPSGTDGRLDNSLVRVNLTNITNNTTNTYTLSQINDRLLETGILNAGNSNSYVLRMWLDYTAGNDAQNKYYATKIRVDSVQKNSTKVCELVDGTHLAIGSKYECNLGDGVKRNFYVLVNDTNTDNVELIMDRNITQGSATPTMSWQNAMAYFETGAGVSIKESWTNIISVGLPGAQDIANAVGNTNWDLSTAQATYQVSDAFFLDPKDGVYGKTQVANSKNLSNYRWLANYTASCSSYGCDPETSLESPEAKGYWTKNVVETYTSKSWNINNYVKMNAIANSINNNCGVRPVVTVLRADLSE